MPNNELLRELELERELYKIEARKRFPVFLNYCNSAYKRQWFHTLIAQKCQDLLDDRIRKLMVFVPPQHGKSEIVSRQFPAWALGKNPDLKIAGCSYSSDLAGQFSRSIQRTIDSPGYVSLFPETCLSGNNIRTVVRGYLRNVDIFEIVGHRGFYRAVGVCGGLTGTPVDIAIIDDPVKDFIEAFSVTYRERVWDWYVNVLLTRLHNDSKQIFIMTRWHDDDLAGRIIKHDGSEWDIVRIPAIKEDDDNPDDPRKIGEALWDERHSVEKLRNMEKLSLRTFTALYQQRPTIDGGNIVKKEWFEHISLSQFMAIRNNAPVHFFLDTAYDEKKSKTDNDPSGILATCKIGNRLFIYHAQKVWKAFPDLIRFLPEYCKAWGYNERGSTLRIEPKANGISVVQQLRESTGINVTKTPAPTDSKETRLNVASLKVECGRVVLVEGEWNESFMEEVCKFPAMAHDEYVDLLSYAVDYHLADKKPVNIGRLANLSR